MYECKDLQNFIIIDLKHMSNSDLTNLASNHYGIIPNHSLIYCHYVLADNLLHVDVKCLSTNILVNY